jgi:hypothetical protein
LTYSISRQKGDNKETIGDTEETIRKIDDINNIRVKLGLFKPH